MGKAERNALVGGTAAVGGLLALWYFFFRDDDSFEEEEIEIEEVDPEDPEELDPIIVEPVKPILIRGRRVIDLTTSGEEYGGVCGVDGATKVDRARDFDWARRALTLLGFPVGTLLSAADKVQIKRFQATARSMGLGAMAGASAAFVDGTVGLCTLDALIEAAILFNAGEWEEPG